MSFNKMYGLPGLPASLSRGTAEAFLLLLPGGSISPGSSVVFAGSLAGTGGSDATIAAVCGVAAAAGKGLVLGGWLATGTAGMIAGCNCSCWTGGRPTGIKRPAPTRDGFSSGHLHRGPCCLFWSTPWTPARKHTRVAPTKTSDNLVCFHICNKQRKP